jgi:hypothetical protein
MDDIIGVENLVKVDSNRASGTGLQQTYLACSRCRRRARECVAMWGWCLDEAALHAASRRDGQQGVAVYASNRKGLPCWPGSVYIGPENRSRINSLAKQRTYADWNEYA